MSQQSAAEGLSRERVLRAAIELADLEGMDVLTMRGLARGLEVSPMGIYHHVPSKEALVDEMVEAVFAEIALPPAGVDWQTAIRARCLSTRDVLRLHPWAAPLMESRPSPGPASLAHHDATIACLRRGGLSVDLTAHAYAILDSYVYGFAFEEASLGGPDGGALERVALEIAGRPGLEGYPSLSELTTDHVLRPGYLFGDTFELGLDLIIAALERGIGSPGTRG